MLTNCNSRTPANDYTCCSPAYVLTQTDDVHNCLYNWINSVTVPVLAELDRLEGFGKDASSQLCKWSDLTMLGELLKDLWHVRVVDRAGNATDQSVQKYWDDFQLNCIRDRFKCLYRIDVTDAYLAVGMYDPSITPSFTSEPVTPS